MRAGIVSVQQRMAPTEVVHNLQLKLNSYIRLKPSNITSISTAAKKIYIY